MLSEKKGPPPLPASNSVWEYKILNLDLKFPGKSEIALNQIGEDGWEAVSLTPLRDAGYAFVLLKRRKKAAV